MSKRYVVFDDKTEEELPDGIPYYEVEVEERLDARYRYFHSTDLRWLCDMMLGEDFKSVRIRKC